jgi:hypothetical protein
MSSSAKCPFTSEPGTNHPEVSLLYKISMFFSHRNSEERERKFSINIIMQVLLLLSLRQT